jgi:hypothetical protein
MQGLFFAHIGPDASGVPGRLTVKTGIVKEQVGAERWLLEFQAQGYCFSNVFRAEQLEAFAFFNTPASRQAFITELMAANAPPASAAEPAAPVTEAPPASVAAP